MEHEKGAAMTRSRAILSSYLGVLVFAVPIFLGAWKLIYWQGLLYVGMALLGTTLNHLLVREGSDITEERASRANEGEAWDKRLLGQLFLMNAVMFLVAGLDSGRFGWSGSWPVGVAIAGAALMLAGQLIFALARRENAFFSSTVRIQGERNHVVCGTGLYARVRHPGYGGMLLSMFAFPLMLQSFWAFIPASLAGAILVERTRREDQFLQAQLPGYAAYATRTRWRLLPGVF